MAGGPSLSALTAAPCGTAGTPRGDSSGVPGEGTPRAGIPRSPDLGIPVLGVPGPRTSVIPDLGPRSYLTGHRLTRLMFQITSM